MARVTVELSHQLTKQSQCFKYVYSFKYGYSLYRALSVIAWGPCSPAIAGWTHLVNWTLSLHCYCSNLVLFFSFIAESLQVAVKASKLADVSQPSEEGPGGAVLSDTLSTQDAPASPTACKWQCRPWPWACAQPQCTRWSHKTDAVATWFQGDLMYFL